MSDSPHGVPGGMKGQGGVGEQGGKDDHQDTAEVPR